MIILKETSLHPATFRFNFQAPQNDELIDLPDGEYSAMRYGTALEIDGKTYHTSFGVRCTRKHFGGFTPYYVCRGIAYPKKKGAS